MFDLTRTDEKELVQAGVQDVSEEIELSLKEDFCPYCGVHASVPGPCDCLRIASGIDPEC